METAYAADVIEEKMVFLAANNHLLITNHWNSESHSQHQYQF